MTTTTDSSPRAPAPPGAPGLRPGPGGGRDLTVGPIGKTLLLFTLPMLGSNILQSLNGSANLIWVSHSLGEAALTATANANIILFLMLGASFGVSMSANILIGQSIGAGDREMAKRVVATSTTFFLVLSIAVGLGGYLLTPAILDAVGTPPDARGDAIAYLQVIFLAMPFIYFFSYVMMAQRATGDARTPFYFSLLMVGLDIVLNPVLIMGLGPAPRMGIAGSATATLISQTITLALMIVHLYRTHSVLVLRRSEWRLLLRPEWSILKSLVLKGLPMSLQMLVVSGAAVVMISFVNRFGSTTAAAYGAASQLWTYVQMPAMALGGAVSSMAAQNVGARRMDRVNQIAGIGSVYAAVFTGLPILLIYLIEPLVLRLFLPGHSPALETAMHINAFVLWGFIPFGVSFVLSGVVRSTGAVWPPLLAMVISLWVVRVPFAQLLIPHLGADAIWWSFPLGSFTLAALAAAYYRWGGWRNSRMLDFVRPGEAPDTSLAPPAVEGETAGEPLGVSRSTPPGPHTPRSEAPGG